MTYCGPAAAPAAAPRPPRPPPAPPMRSSILSPLAERSKLATPAASFSERRVLRSNRKRASTATRAASAASSGFDEKDDAGAAGSQRGVTARGKRKRENALLELVEIDAHGLGRGFRSGVGAARAAASTSTASAARCRGAIGRSFAGRFFFVALGRERRGEIVWQNDEINVAGDFVLIAGHIETARGGAVVGAGREIEILAVAIEGGMAGVAEAVGDLMRLTVVERIDEDGVEAIGKRCANR